MLVEQLHNENLKLAWAQCSSDYQDMFKKIHVYRDKLINIKKEMRLLHEKSTKLKVLYCSRVVDSLEVIYIILNFRKERYGYKL